MGKMLQKYFIPNKDNDYQPHMLQKAAAGGMLMLMLVGFILTDIQALVLVNSERFITTILPAVLVDLTNDSREEERVNLLTRDPLLDRAAQLKAQHMAESSYFAHNSPDGVTPWHWFDEVGYEYSYAGENLAVHFTDSKAVVDAWMESPGHRANILEENYTSIGIGTAKGTYEGYSTVFVVQLFARPAIASPIAFPDATAVAGSSTSTPTEASVESEEVAPVVAAEETSSTSPATTTTDTGTTSDSEDVNPATTTPAEPESPALFSDLATTSNGVPAGSSGILDDVLKTGIDEGDVPPQTNAISRLATQPRQVLGIIYALLASLIVIALVFSIVIEWRRQHPVQIAYGTGLLATMALMIFVQEILLSGVLIV